MLTPEQIDAFNRNGYLIVPDVVPQITLEAIRTEYQSLMDDLYDGWWQSGQVKADPASLDFWGKLRSSYEAGCDWFQPMDISLPGDTIYADTPMHFGPAVFDLVRCDEILDVVESQCEEH